MQSGQSQRLLNEYFSLQNILLSLKITERIDFPSDQKWNCIFSLLIRIISIAIIRNSFEIIRMKIVSYNKKNNNEYNKKNDEIVKNNSGISGSLNVTYSFIPFFLKQFILFSIYSFILILILMLSFILIIKQQLQQQQITSKSEYTQSANNLRTKTRTYFVLRFFSFFFEKHKIIIPQWELKDKRSNLKKRKSYDII